MKAEILKALENITVGYADFDHEYGYSNRSYSTCTKYIESENYNIEVEFEEEVRWTEPDFYEFENLAVTDFIVTALDGEVEPNITDKEILNSINY